MSRIALASLCLARATAGCLALAPPAFAEPYDPGPAAAGATLRDRLNDAEHKATDILSQPVRDVGLFGHDVPEPLQRASHDPYGLAPSLSCADIDAEIARLDGALGREPPSGERQKENRVEKMAEAGGRAVVNSLIPYRAVVREVSGAAPAERRLQAAMDFGYERRGFLRGVYRAHGCEPTASADPNLALGRGPDPQALP